MAKAIKTQFYNPGVVSNVIDVGKNLVIPDNTQYIVYKKMTVNGTITVEGNGELIVLGASN